MDAETRTIQGRYERCGMTGWKEDEEGWKAFENWTSKHERCGMIVKVAELKVKK